MRELKFSNKLCFLPLAVFSVLLSVTIFTKIPEFYVIAVVMVLLAEPHFGASWPYIFSREYKDIFKEHKISLVIVPVLIVIVALLIFFFLGFTIFSYLFLAANMYHVNKQSLGMVKMQGLSKAAFSSADLDCHIPSIVFLAFHLFALNAMTSHLFAVLLLIAVLGYIFWRLPLKGYENTENVKPIYFYSSVIQMSLVWFPLAIFSNPILALAVGVSIHYVQYLLFTGHIFANEKNRNLIIAFVVIYAVCATYIQSFGVNVIPWIIVLTAIPQLLHFYLDGFFWKFSNPKIRERLVSNLF
tara:strand:+ start:1766 stop:2662 length:897 start_codon:yes stop_codon:yes gene_type:complete